MKICTLYGTTFRIHPLFWLIALFCVLSGQGVMIISSLLALLLHEAGHLYAAYKLKLPVSEVELTPFGGAMQIALSDGISGKRGFALAGAGILMNLICAVCAALSLCLSPSVFLKWFLLSNLSMLLFNLIPVLPLDGGRMFLSFLSPRMGKPRAMKLLLMLGRLLSVGMMLYSLYGALRGCYYPSWMLLGCYMLYAAALEEKHNTARYLSALFSRRFKIENDASVPVQQLCVRADMKLFTLLPQLQPNAYHILSVVDDSACHILGTICEDRLFRAVMDTPSATVGNIMNS